MVPFKHSISFGLGVGASDNRVIPVDIDEWHNLSVLLHVFKQHLMLKWSFFARNDGAYKT